MPMPQQRSRRIDSDAGAHRCVVMLTAGFPPDVQSVTVLRTAKFAKYLPDFGWVPVILTPRIQDGLRGREVEPAPQHVPVVRTRYLPTLSVLARQFVRRSSEAPDGSVSTDLGEKGVRGLGLSSIIRWILLWGDTPDKQVGWIPWALWYGRRLVRSHGAVAIHASGPPFSIVLAGALLSRATGLPLIADFRDTWMQDASDPCGSVGGDFRSCGSKRRLALIRALERWCLAQASAVLFTSRATQHLYEDAYPNIRLGSHIIYNGVDPDDLPGVGSTFERPTITYVGALHEFQWPQVRQFLEGFALALSRSSLPVGTRVTLVGSVAPRVAAAVRESCRALGIDSSVALMEPVPHHEAVSWMQRSHLLLLFVGDNPYIRLTKISEYVAVGRPMLAFATSGSETGSEVASYGGTVVSDGNVESVTGVLPNLLVAGLQSAPSNGIRTIAHPHPLNRQTNAQQLATILDSLVSHPLGPSAPGLLGEPPCLRSR